MRNAGLAMLALAACTTPPPTGHWLDSGDLDRELPVLVVTGAGWLGLSHRITPAIPGVMPDVQGWPVAACLDRSRDGECDFGSEPFAMCQAEGSPRRPRCSLRPWKISVVRTQVFDGALTSGDGAILLAAREHETAVHASASAFLASGEPTPAASLCWVPRGLCATRIDAASEAPLIKMCGVDEYGTAELELDVGSAHARVDDPLPEPIGLRLDSHREGDEILFEIVADVELYQVLAQVRAGAAASDQVLWTSSLSVDAYGRPSHSVEVRVPRTLLTGSTTDRTLLLQMVSVSQRAVDARLLVQASTETRVWLSAPGVKS